MPGSQHENTTNDFEEILLSVLCHLKDKNVTHYEVQKDCEAHMGWQEHLCSQGCSKHL